MSEFLGFIKNSAQLTQVISNYEIGLAIDNLKEIINPRIYFAYFTANTPVIKYNGVNLTPILGLNLNQFPGGAITAQFAAAVGYVTLTETLPPLAKIVLTLQDIAGFAGVLAYNSFTFMQLFAWCVSAKPAIAIQASEGVFTLCPDCPEPPACPDCPTSSADVEKVLIAGMIILGMLALTVGVLGND